MVSSLLLLTTLVQLAVVYGHGRLTQPRARNINDNGAVAGGPGSVHSYTNNEQTKYKHGVCGNAAGSQQNYNRVGDVQATYVSGSVAEFKVTITAHHVGYFEFELCTDAGLLSEECFMMHRLLKEGCHCMCENDSTHSCAACDDCRRWWKPLLEGEMGQWVAGGYGGPTLPGQGNLVPYEFTMRYVIPSGLKSRNGVLRWHYMTTNSCTSKSSAPEEFWNCADVSITDASGHAGGQIDFDNKVLESMVVHDLVDQMKNGALTGVFSTCPRNEDDLVGVAPAAEYNCGEKMEDTWEYCKDLSAGSGSLADCSDSPASGILCESQCSSTWFQCSGGIAYTKAVPTGTKCKNNGFVLAASCVSDESEYPITSSTNAETTVETTRSPTTTELPETSVSTSESPRKCGSCSGCLWSTGECYTDVESAAYCQAWPQNLWCGVGVKLIEAQIKPHRHRFLASEHALLQGMAKLQTASLDEL